MNKWISVEERLPAESHSLFYPWYGTKKWTNAMWKEESDKVLVTIRFPDGKLIAGTGWTMDGKWKTSVSDVLHPTVTHWMEMPEPAT